MTLRNLHGKRVLVTGAASGIGRATALAFASMGADLLLCDLVAERLAAVRDEVCAFGVNCTSFGVDVADEAAMHAFSLQVHAQGGPLDVLVNNAGIGYLGAFLDSPLDAWRRTLGINLMGVVHGLRCFLPQMHEAGGPRRIVNVASVAGIAPAPNMSVYAASKSAVIGLSESLSMELRLRNSRVGLTVVCPGIINTAITHNANNVSPSIDAAQLAKLQAYYEAKGVHADVVAHAIVDAVRSGRELVLVGPFARPLYHLRRLSRSLLRRVLLIDARKMGYC
ncbi:SDR family NAD(P)-dependent oxidoreductase [Variovorax sp. GT1P44]|uniref:SDR family NAD(P)-dependent oxidoreductase n=1 Tax=Variovorax sp. GT1P44 TaxID=3443742 RepID=UPI003F48A05D